MERDGHLKSLADRMREKAEQERIQTENVFKEQLETLSASLRESSTNALRTMSGAMEQEITTASESLTRHYRILSMAYGKAWMRTALTALAVATGLTVGGWTLAKAGAWNLGRYRTDLAQLKTEVEEQRQTLTELKAETWGLIFRDNEKGRFIVIPVGMKIDTTWKEGERQAIRLEE